MKGQPEAAPDTKLGKKIMPREVITPDWKAVPGKQYHYVHTKTGAKKYAPPVPDSPRYSPTNGPTNGRAWEVWAEYIRKQMQGASWDS